MPVYGAFQKGQFKSEYVQDGFFELTNCDVHTKAGTVKAELALSQESTTPNEQCIVVAADDGTMFFLSKESGKIWKRTTGGVYSLARTNANGAHVGGGVFNNRLWYATSTKLGYYDLASTWADSHGTFTNTTTTRPFLRGGVNRAFAYFGDGAQLARVDKDNTFSANVLEIPLGETITDLVEWGNDIAITAIGVRSKIYRWNQYGDTYYKPDLIAHKDIDALLQSTQSNVTYALCRTKDSYLEFMYYTGLELNEIKERRIESTTAIDSYHKVEFDGRPFFAIDDKVYSMKSQGIVCEYTCSSSGATINGIDTDGSDLYVHWTNGASDAVDTIGSNRADAVIQTPVYEGKAQTVYVYYETVSGDATLSLRVKVNGGSWYARTMVQESQHNRFAMRDGFKENNVNLVQAEVTIDSDSTDTVIVRSIEIV